MLNKKISILNVDDIAYNKATNSSNIQPRNVMGVIVIIATKKA
jgi:hypothetical protein